MSAPAPSSGESALAISAWPLRRKLALALAIPLLLAGTFGGLRVQSDLAAASNSAASAQQVTVLRPAVEYLTAAERAMVAAVAWEGGSRSALERALADLGAAGDDLLEAKDGAGLSPEQRYQVDAVLDLSQALRGEDALALSPGTWVAQLRQLQSGVTRLITTIVNEQLEPEPRLELLSQALAGRSSLAMQQALAATDRTGETASLELFSELGVEGAAIDRLAGAMAGSQDSVASLRTANAQRFRTVRTGGADLGGQEAYADYDSIIGTLQDGVDEELAAAATDARTDALLNAVITLVALGAAILLALVVSRLLLNPIRKVREGALAVAHARLPEAVARIRSGEEVGEITPIEVTTEEEIGQLARAVDDMHRQAVVLAAGEADLRSQVSQMFLTLSRRNTSLINQQLDLIERLERDEEDPKRLESLFRLDHLAARMRRTADSLLILADAPPAAAAADGLTVSDALQAATAGVQDYQRVRLRSTTPLRISRAAAADVVHVLTELVDNALSYSPPTSPVELDSRATPDGVVIEISDAGLGIPADQLEAANAALASGGEVTPDTARRMGLFVVSRLSQRHGLATTLAANEQGGLTATVVLPPALLPDLAPAKPADQRTTGPRPLTVAPRPQAPATTRVAADEPRAEMDLAARIDAALGLPVRRPGANGKGSGAPAPVTPATAPAALARLRPQQKPDEPPADLQTVVESVVGAFGDPISGPAVEAQPPAALPVRRNGSPRDDDAVPPDLLAEPEAAEPQAAEPEADAREAAAPSAPPPPPAPATALDDAWTDPGDDGVDTPIFRSLRSAWLSPSEDAQPWRTTEIEAGWEKVDQVAEQTAPPAVSESGLPVRRPGTRLVPGGVSQVPTVRTRDPEAIRARLAAHASGVSRGRAAASTSPSSTPSPSEK